MTSVDREAQVQSFGVASKRLAVLHDPGAVEQDIDVADFRAPRPSIATSVGHVQHARLDLLFLQGEELLVDVGGQTCAPSAAEASAAPRPFLARPAVTNATLPARRPAMRAIILPCPARCSTAAPWALLRCGRGEPARLQGRTAISSWRHTGHRAAIVKRLEASGAKCASGDLTARRSRPGCSSIKKATEDALKAGEIYVLATMQAWQTNVPTADYPIEEWSVCCAINLTSHVLSRGRSRHMVKAGYGRIVNFASVAGKEGNPMRWRIPRPGRGISLTKSPASELAQSGVLVNCVTSGGGETGDLPTR